MPPSLARFALAVLAVTLPLPARAEPLPRKESNVSLRNEVQIAIDKGLAHLQATQRADGTWGKPGTSGFALQAFQCTLLRLGRPARKAREFEPILEKGYEGLRRAFPAKGGLTKMDDPGWNLPPALLALNLGGAENAEFVERGTRALAGVAVPKTPEAQALFLAIDPKHRPPGGLPARPTGSALTAWLWLQRERTWDAAAPAGFKPVEEVTAWLREHYTVERNPGGEGVHQYYFWLSSVLGPAARGLVERELKLANGSTVDVPRQLAEKLINEQNGNGSWSGVGGHWTEKDPDLVTAFSLLTLEQVYEQL